MARAEASARLANCLSSNSTTRNPMAVCAFFTLVNIGILLVRLLCVGRFIKVLQAAFGRCCACTGVIMTECWVSDFTSSLISGSVDSRRA